MALLCAPRVLYHSAAPQGFVPESSEYRADEPLTEGDAICCVREKFAIGVAVHVPKQVCHPVRFWMP